MSAAGSLGRVPGLSPHDGRPRAVWRFSDRTPGHDSQSLGLVEALGRRLAVDVHTVAVPERAASWRDLLNGRYAALARLPEPWLLVGAGRRTHLPLLVARRACGGRAVVIMRPSLPRALFDLCIIPDHDRPAAAPNVLVSRGSLNRLQRVEGGKGEQGLILIGGPSRHYRWRNEAVVAQIARILQESPLREWVVAASGRTPAGFAPELTSRLMPSGSHLTFLVWEAANPGHGVAAQLARARCAWVTADSVSMLYEALTAGIATGVLELPARGHSRVLEGLRRLEATGQVTGFADWAAGNPLLPPGQVFDEANRIARRICEQWGAPSPGD